MQSFITMSSVVLELFKGSLPKSPNYEITQCPTHPILKSPNGEVTQCQSHPMSKSPNSMFNIVVDLYGD